MAKINLADWIECTEVEGPGKRFALWVQGCLLRCPGCCNPQMFDMSPRNIIETDEILKWITFAKAKHGIEGVSFLGGEPMLQSKGLAEVAFGCKEIGLPVIVFSGYTLEYLKKNPMLGVLDLLSYIDILVDGPYDSTRQEMQRNWVGSTNQEFHYFSNRYSPGIEFDPKYSHGLELHLYEDGTLRSNGWPFNLIFPELPTGFSPETKCAFPRKGRATKNTTKKSSRERFV